jgi:hypothetical protein
MNTLLKQERQCRLIQFRLTLPNRAAVHCRERICEPCLQSYRAGAMATTGEGRGIRGENEMGHQISPAIDRRTWGRGDFTIIQSMNLID